MLFIQVSTALWTGIYLADLLAYVKPIKGLARHVIFEGGDSLPDGPYGTSQRLSWAANKERGMLIGESLNCHWDIVPPNMYAKLGQ